MTIIGRHFFSFGAVLHINYFFAGRHHGQVQKERHRRRAAQHYAAKASNPTATTVIEEASKPNTEQE